MSSAERASFAPELRPEDRYLNRELSWLDFDRRVLALAEDPHQPLLERIKFLAITSRNLDEFFQVRVAGLHAQRESPLSVTSPDGRTPEQQLREIRAKVVDLVHASQDVFAKQLAPALAEAGIHIVPWSALGAADRATLASEFEKRIFPVLTPLAVDPAHPFPYVSNLSFNVAAMVRDPDLGTVRFARIKVPSLLDRFLALPGERYVPVEQVIGAHLERLFPGMEILSWSPFRVSRDADLDLEEDEAEDLLAAIESELQRRRRLSDAVRLEVDRGMSERALDLLLEELELGRDDVYVNDALLDLGSLWQLYERIPRPDLRDELWVPQPAPRVPKGGDAARRIDLFALLRERDLLVHHPYESFETSFQEFLAQAADDPSVLAIKHTLYRSSGPESPIGRTLIRAAQNGKQVVTLIELKARFDEETNISWARKLEQAGVHVVYGLVGLKTHAKVALVVRNEPDGIRRYCHFGTGNYHPLTARLYEDLGVFTADDALGADLGDLFNHLTGWGKKQPYRKILVAPEGLRAGLLEKIRAEMDAPDGRIVMKLNGLSDPGLIDALYDASQAGVEIDLVVRGICCLRPGVPGLSERIRVRSILGRFLEHSRIFRFGNERRGLRYFIGSADLMGRNLDKRIEVVAPIEDPALAQRVEEILDLLLDDGGAWELDGDGTWQHGSRRTGPETQRALRERAQARAALE
ncbi:MAG TPA: polyphosphate kinase 1 [Myxococcota bacterium]|nr:polyphosphate kinase 1 [Myxococcota bacterium]